jgi:hypothetical protein
VCARERERARERDSTLDSKHNNAPLTRKLTLPEEHGDADRAPELGNDVEEGEAPVVEQRQRVLESERGESWSRHGSESEGEKERAATAST